MCRLSFIVPIYNVELYIEECIRSLYDQDIPYDEYEVICVDDCSPDNSRLVVESLLKEYPTLKLVCHDRNKKLGGARNTGLQYAIGKYIWFVDSDDYVYSNVLHLLLDTAESNALDILQFNHVRDVAHIINDLQFSEIMNGEMYLFGNLSREWFHKIGGAWKQLFSRDFLEKIRLKYIEDAMYEDTDYLLHAFLLAKRVQYISTNAYHYRTNYESITKTSMSPIKLAWRVNLMVRCAQLVNIAQSNIAQVTINEMVSNTLSQLRNELKCFSLKQKMDYTSYLSTNVNKCRDMMTWRTWLALRYGITWFI